MKWQKVKFPAYIANHYFRDKHGPCLMCGAKFRAMVSADPAGWSLYWNGVGRVDDTTHGLPVHFQPAGRTLH